MKKMLLFLSSIICYVQGFAQFTINTPIYITGGAQITVFDLDVNATSSIFGNGSILFKNTINTNLNCNNNELPSVILDCNSGSSISLSSNAIINGNLQFVNGKMNTNNNDLILQNTASTSGANASSYIVNNGSGKIVKNISSNLTNFLVPIGTIANYQPILFTTVGTYALGANVTAKVNGAIHPNKPLQNTDYLNVYWPISKTGITGSVDAVANYIDINNIIGNESNIKASMYTVSGWQNNGTINNTTINNNGASLTTASADLFGMNTFVQLNAKVFLQGAYNLSTSKMNDGLRIPTNLIPLSDPYRVAPYATSFVQVNNANIEIVNASVFANQAIADNNIVDWVFVEIRNGLLGNNKIKTRSALVQRDGDIVDVDGISPLFLKDVLPGQYSIAIRHRNHLGLCTDPNTNLQTLDMKPPIGVTDFTTYTDAQLFGKADSNYKVQGGKNLLYAGNANFNTKVSFSGLSSDKDRIFSRLTNQPNNLTVNNVYDASDINMNRFVRFVNLNNDKDFLFGVLGNSALNTKNQALP